MELGRAVSETDIQRCPDLFGPVPQTPSIKTPGSSFKQSPSPPDNCRSQCVKNPSDFEDPNLPPFLSAEVPPQLSSRQVNIRYGNYEGDTQKNGHYNTMFESPARSLQGSLQAQEKLKSTTQKVIDVGLPLQSYTLDGNPPRQDSACYSVHGREDGSEIDVELQARQTRARERVIVQRARVLQLRAIKQEQKSHLRQLRNRARDSLGRLTRKLNELSTLRRLDNFQSEIRPFYDDLQAAQDELGPAEDAYDHLEYRLDEEELDLEEEEDHFYRHHDVISLNVPEVNLDEKPSPLVKAYHPPDSEFQDISLKDMTLQDFLAKVEEAEKAKEELDDMEIKYNRLSADAKFRNQHGYPQSTETAHFLTTYTMECQEILTNLHNIERDILELRRDCVQQGLFDASEYIYEVRDAFYDEVMESVDEARDRSPLRAAADYHQERTVDFQDKRDYINKWLLEWVPDSTVDKMMLQAWIYFEYPDTKYKSEELGEDRWAELAVDNWDKDSAGNMANKFFTASRLDFITGDGPGARNLNNLNTTRSGPYGSLDVALEEEEPADDELAKVPILLTQESDHQVTPTRQSCTLNVSPEVLLKYPRDKYSTPFIYSSPVGKARSLNAFDMRLDHTACGANLSIESPTRARRAVSNGGVNERPYFQSNIPSLQMDTSPVFYNDTSRADITIPLR